MVGHGGGTWRGGGVLPRPVAGTFVGTHGFMAPEMFKKQEYERPCDLYSWGMCIYCLDAMDNFPPDTPEAQIQVSLQDFKYLP